LKKRTKYKIKVLISFFTFSVFFILLFGILGALECDTITIGQALKRAAICLLVLGADAWWINVLGGRIKCASKMHDMSEVLDYEERDKAI
jgi:hypothetical protein